MIDNKQKVLNLLGLAQKAGKVISGTELVTHAIQGETVNLVFLASDSSENTIKEFVFLSEKFQIQLVKSFSSQEISDALGKKRKVVAVQDRGFARAILDKLNKERD